MTQTKLEIIGPYTPDHPGPFCTRDGKPARIICTDRRGEYPIVALVDELWTEHCFVFSPSGEFILENPQSNLMNAREVPMEREFWVNEYSWGFGDPKQSIEQAKQSVSNFHQYIRTIHVREVLPGDGE